MSIRSSAQIKPKPVHIGEYRNSSPGLLAIADRDRIEVNNAESGGIDARGRRVNYSVSARASSRSVAVLTVHGFTAVGPAG